MSDDFLARLAMPRAYIEMIFSSKPRKPPLVLGDQVRIEGRLPISPAHPALSERCR